MTYADLAQALNVSIASAQRRVVRAGWTRAAGTDGVARVAVPLSVLPFIPPDGQKDRFKPAQPFLVGQGSDQGEDAKSVISRLLDSLEAMDASREAECVGRAQDRTRWEAERAKWAAEHATLREQLARREGELSALREGAAQPAAPLVRGILLRLRGWLRG
ncbi:hypothetical protein [Muricoccus vinaceus]|uniref:MarR family transcriptional regulator n=1 Tax=Muricoccus vinaceus TaxID=424704 RepID=A0ABV6IVH6_9PROT